jgi:hypothetical protein
MPFIGLSLVIQLLCAVHCVRSGRNQMWLMVIIFLSIPGCLAYAVFEILPGYTGRRDVRLAKAAAIRKLDPERELRNAREALDVADTASNRIALADALVDLEKWDEAIDHYRRGLGKTAGADRGTQLKLARAELAAGRAQDAREHLETLPESGSASENDRAKLLLAQALEECGERAAALDLYADIGRRLPGGEAQCRQAGLLMAMGRPGEAQAALEEVERILKLLDRYERSQRRDMYDWAARTLSELRGPA